MYYVSIFVPGYGPMPMAGEDYGELAGAKRAAQEMADETADQLYVMECVEGEAPKLVATVSPCVWAPCGYAVCAEFSGSACSKVRACSS